MANLENKFVNNFHCKPLMYCRYIDDIFSVFPNINMCNEFLSFLNSQHKNIKFTMEGGSNTLPFLDVSVSILDNKFCSKVYFKKTNTNLILNFNAFCPLMYKIGLIKCFLHRAFVVCSSWCGCEKFNHVESYYVIVL